MKGGCGALRTNLGGVVAAIDGEEEGVEMAEYGGGTKAGLEKIIAVASAHYGRRGLDLLAIGRQGRWLKRLLQIPPQQ